MPDLYRLQPWRISRSISPHSRSWTIGLRKWSWLSCSFCMYVYKYIYIYICMYSVRICNMYVCMYCTIHMRTLSRPNVEWFVRPSTSIQASIISVVQRIIIRNFVIPLCFIHSQPRLPGIHKHMHSENWHEVKANDRSSPLRTPYLNYPIF